MTNSTESRSGGASRGAYKLCRRSTRWRGQPGGWAGLLLALPLLILLLLFVLYPVVDLLISSVAPPTGLDRYQEFLESPVARKTLVLTIVGSLVITVLAVVLGGLMAWAMLTSRSVLVRATLWVAILMPMWMGVVVKNYAFVLILGREGILNTVARWLGLGNDDSAGLLYTPAAVVIGILYSMLPYATLPLYVGLRQLDQNTIAAAQSLGATRSTALRTIILPQAVPGLAASSVIVFVISIGFYVTPILLGGPRAGFIASRIQDQLFKYFDTQGAQVSAVVLLIIAIAIVGLSMRVVGTDRLQRALR